MNSHHSLPALESSVSRPGGRVAGAEPGQRMTLVDLEVLNEPAVLMATAVCHLVSLLTRHDAHPKIGEHRHPH